jgi:hypothetical protein
MKHVIPTILLVIACAVGCETVVVSRPPGPPPHAPARGYHKKYVYHYYPDLEVYWSVDLHSYAVFERGHWIAVRYRPAILTEAHRYIVLEVDEREPWRHHSVYKEKYPPGQAKFRGGPKGRQRKR